MTEKTTANYGSMARGYPPAYGRPAPATPPPGRSGIYVPPSHPGAAPEKK
jgi:hypothetical protein